MIRHNQRQLNQLNILTDAMLVFASYVFASWLWLGVIKKETNMAALANWDNGVGVAAALYALWTVIVLGAFRRRAGHLLCRRRRGDGGQTRGGAHRAEAIPCEGV